MRPWDLRIRPSQIPEFNVDPAAVRQTIERASREGEDYEHHYRLLMPDGSAKYLRMNTFEGSDRGKQAEAALRRSEQLWHDVFVIMVDGQGSIMAVNPFGAEQLGYTVEELVGQPVLQLFFDADREAAQNRVGPVPAATRPVVPSGSWHQSAGNPAKMEQQR